MKLKPTFLTLLAGAALAVAGTRTASAQDPVVPAATPASRATTVYLSKDYTKSLEANKLFDSDKFVAIFVGIQADFLIFKQAGSDEQIYIPKSAVLYMRGPGGTKLAY